MQSSANTPSGQTRSPNNQSYNPSPDQIRELVLDYLCHNCYTSTARAFARDSSIRHIDADGDEIMQLEKASADAPVGLTEETMRLVELREQIRVSILSGCVEDAVSLLNEHFPSVLSETAKRHKYLTERPSTDRLQYRPPTSIDPAHVSFNLRILAFTEACRTVPLPYNAPKSKSVANSAVPQTFRDIDDLTKINQARKLYALMHALPKSSDREIYQVELTNVGGLLGHTVPEKSDLSRYLSQERREAVADQVNNAILDRIGLSAISDLELYTRYTLTLWSFMHALRVQIPALVNRPPGINFLPTGKVDIPSAKGSEEWAPLFDLQQFLDFKS